MGKLKRCSTCGKLGHNSRFHNKEEVDMEWKDNYPRKIAPKKNLDDLSVRKQDMVISRRIPTKEDTLKRITSVVTDLRLINQDLQEYGIETICDLVRDNQGKFINGRMLVEHFTKYGWTDLFVKTGTVFNNIKNVQQMIDKVVEGHNKPLYEKKKEEKDKVKDSLIESGCDSICCVCQEAIILDSSYKPMPCHASHYICYACRYQLEVSEKEVNISGEVIKIPYLMIRCPLCMKWSIKHNGQPPSLELLRTSPFVPFEYKVALGDIPDEIRSSAFDEEEQMEEEEDYEMKILSELSAFYETSSSIFVG